MRRTSLVCCGLLIVVAGCGGTSNASRAEPVSVRIGLSEMPGALVQWFSLTCNPTGGTLPFAARVCGDINRHRKAMLDPGPMQGGPCEGMGPYVSLVTTVAGKTKRAAGIPGCWWPGTVRFGIYYSAGKRVTGSLTMWERRLHCDETAHETAC